MLKETSLTYFKTLTWFGSIYVLLRLPVYGFAWQRYYPDIVIIFVGPLVYAIIVTVVGRLVSSIEELDKSDSTKR